MKKVFSLLITLAMLISTVAVPMSASADTTVWDGTVAESFAGGDGSEENPYLISNGAELAYLASKVWSATTDESMASVRTAGGYVTTAYNVYTNTYFELTADIDLGNEEWKPIGRFGARFNGIFDGKGHVIKNISVTKPYVGIGLFGATGKNTKISNLGLENFNVSVNSAVNGDKLEEIATYGAIGDLNGISGSGAMVGIVGGGTYENCYTKNVSFINESYTSIGEGGFGGFAGDDKAIDRGDNAPANFKSCYVMGVTAKTADMTSGFWAKGVAEADGFWQCANSTITDCYVAGELNLTSRYDTYVSSFAVYRDYAPTAKNCYTTGTAFRNNGDVLTATSTKQDIVDNISTASGFIADNAQNPINDGYPILSWQADWIWDGSIADSFAGGDGSEKNPYLISNGAELAYLAEKVYTAVDNTTGSYATGMENHVKPSDDTNGVNSSNNLYNVYTGKHFRLTADIDLGNREWKPIGRDGARFDGVFDGNGHVVENISITTAYTGMGFFGATGHNAVIKNLGLEKVNMTFNGKKSADYSTYGGRFNYVWGTGSMVGLATGSFENCYVKNTVLKNNATDSGEAGLGGFSGQAIGIHQHAGLSYTNCYVIDANITGTTASVGFAAHQNGGELYNVKTRKFTNCYVGGTLTLNKNNNNTAISGFARTTQATNYPNAYDVSKCYSVGDTYIAADPLQTQSTLSDIVNGLKDVEGWSEDNATSPINGGYPVLDWQNTWKKPYEVKAITAAGGYVTGVTLKENDETVSGTVIVAVYSGDRFVGAVTADAADGEVDITDIAAASGSVVKVFVWDSLSALNPVAYEYATTIE